MFRDYSDPGKATDEVELKREREMSEDVGGDLVRSVVRLRCPCRGLRSNARAPRKAEALKSQSGFGYVQVFLLRVGLMDPKKKDSDKVKFRSLLYKWYDMNLGD